MQNENYINVVSGLNSSIDNAILAAKEKDRIILYFGGGLSSNKYMRENLGPLLLETTFHPDNVPNSHPIITQWETSPFELDSIKSILTELLDVKDINKIRNWLKRKLGIDAKGLTPLQPKDETAKNILISVGFTEEEIESEEESLSDYEIENRIEQLFIEDGDDLKEGIQSIDSNLRKKAPKGLIAFKTIKVIYLILKRFALKTDHGAYTTIIEELCRFFCILS